MSETVEKQIERVKASRDAVILSHNFQLPEVQEVADFMGESLGLSRQAASGEALEEGVVEKWTIAHP